MGKKSKILLLLFLMLLGTAGCALSASAANKTGWKRVGNYYTYYSEKGELVTGWKKVGDSLFYFRPEAEGKAPQGSRVVGFYQIGKRTFYFNRYGMMQRGWKTIGGKNYYFRMTGLSNVIGMMYVGLYKIGDRYFYFKKDGSAAVGWRTIDGDTYFFSTAKTLGVRGGALTGWRDIGGYRYFFNAAGVMQKGRWVYKKYYVDEKGHMLKSTVTPDGYVVNAQGVKQRLANGWIRMGGKYYYYVNGKMTTGWKTISGKKYYFSNKGVRKVGWLTLDGSKYYLKGGVMQTGWVVVDGKTYYFKKNGKMAVSTTVDGIQIDEKGIAEKTPDDLPVETKARVLLIAGHGQGDTGAVGYNRNGTFYEYKLTREFATLIKNKLEATSKAISVTMYNQNYDCYQVLSGKKSGPNPNLLRYDYVLEVHFNATVPSGKDPGGNGAYKGTSMYVNSAKTKVALDLSIVKAISRTGFKIFGSGNGLYRSSGLFNAKTCQAKGVPYGLLETAFIDDKDDMAFYNKNKNKMAQAVADTIIAYYDK